MPKKPSQTTQVIGNPADPEGLYRFMILYLEDRKVKHYAATTLVAYRNALIPFIVWCEPRGLYRPTQITKPILERYQRHLFHYRRPNGNPLAASTQASRITYIKNFFRWLTKQNYLLYNPASEIELPKVSQRLPRDILSLSEVEHVLAQPDVDTPLGVRDRAIMEVFYSTGMRRHELANLKVHHVDTNHGAVFIYLGKGGKDRMIPIGERALQWVMLYINDIRPEYACGQDEDYVFLNMFGESMRLATVSNVVKNNFRKANIDKKGGCHLFRHTMATHMLENGADIRFIQAMLGHSKLETTEIYTRVSIKKLKEIHTATHPAKPKETTTATELLEDVDSQSLEDQLFQDLADELGDDLDD